MKTDSHDWVSSSVSTQRGRLGSNTSIFWLSVPACNVEVGLQLDILGTLGLWQHAA